MYTTIYIIWYILYKLYTCLYMENVHICWRPKPCQFNHHSSIWGYQPWSWKCEDGALREPWDLEASASTGVTGSIFDTGVHTIGVPCICMHLFGVLYNFWYPNMGHVPCGGTRNGTSCCSTWCRYDPSSFLDLKIVSWSPYLFIVWFYHWVCFYTCGCFTIKQPVLDSTPDAQEMPSPAHSSRSAHATPPASFYLASTPDAQQAIQCIPMIYIYIYVTSLNYKWTIYDLIEYIYIYIYKIKLYIIYMFCVRVLPNPIYI